MIAMGVILIVFGVLLVLNLLAEMLAFDGPYEMSPVSMLIALWTAIANVSIGIILLSIS